MNVNMTLKSHTKLSATKLNKQAPLSVSLPLIDKIKLLIAMSSGLAQKLDIYWIKPTLLLSKHDQADGNTFSYLLANPSRTSVSASDISGAIADSPTHDTHPVSCEGTQHIPLHSGWVGYYAYPAKAAEAGTSKSEFHYYPWSICLDHTSGDFYLLGNPDSDAQQMFDALAGQLVQLFKQLFKQTTPAVNVTALPFKARPFNTVWSRQQYQQAFACVQEYLHAGDCYQVNLTQPHKASYTGLALATLAPLYSALNPSFGCYFEGHDCELVSVSPERFMSIDATGRLEAKPIKGTIKRSCDTTQDQLYIDELTNSKKNQAENLMIVDLLRNDLSISATPNSVNVEKLFELETHPYVHHLVSTISAQLKPNLTPAEAITNAFPGGSITGAPKKRAMEIIAELEAEPRSLYCGSFGYYADSGHADFNILIRSIEFRQGEITCWGGGGITVDSDCDEEYEESLTKVRKIMEVIEGI